MLLGYDKKRQNFTLLARTGHPPVLGPVGTAHMSDLDFAQWAEWAAGQGAPASGRYGLSKVIDESRMINQTPFTLIRWGIPAVEPVAA